MAWASGCGSGTSGSTGPRRDTVAILNKDVQAVRNFNVFSATAHSYPAEGLVFEAIARIDTFHGAAVKPWLASGWEFSEGGKALTFTVRKGIRFADGHPLTADDFLYSMQQPLKHTELKQSGLNYQKVEKVSEDQVRCYFDAPAYQDLPNCVNIKVVPAHVWSQHDPVTWTCPDPMGTGPCLLESFSTQQAVMRRRRSGYWGGRIAPEYVKYKSATEDSAKLLMIAGELDLSTIAWPGGQEHYVDRDPSRFIYNPAPSGGSEGVRFNLTKPPWNDVHVRRALSMTIDRKAVSTVLNDGQPPMPITNLDTNIYRDWLLPEYAGKIQELDVAGARRELEAGGWSVEGGRLVKDGKHYPILFKFITDYPAWHIEAAVVADQWSKHLGLNVHQIAQPAATLNNQVNSGDFEISYAFLGSGNGIYTAYRDLDPALAAPIGKVASANAGRWKDPKTKRILARMRATDDHATLLECGHQLQRIVVEQVPYIPVLGGGIWNAINTTYWQDWPNDKNSPMKVADSTPDLVLGLQQLKRRS
ncbi:MAG TPA: ABC transporter substrate-binding protein [Mycobacteriales bacterium]|nr:ABC transporter substrate-binding protein [Mycobacteriales bacterium]